MWVLQSPDAESGPLILRLSPGTVRTVGRAAGADFVVPRPLVSRLHCRLTADDHILEVQDLESTNGTFVNGRRVSRARLTAGDRLQIGRLELVVERREERPDAETEGLTP